MINNNLKEYLDTNILVQYKNYDRAHNIDHILSVIKASFELIKDYNLNEDMVYTIAIFHDLGLPQGRDTHHLTSAILLENDSYIKNYFNNEQIEIMKHAIEDHRASNPNKPRNIYGEIISSADRIIDVDTIIYRTLVYGLDHNNDISVKDNIKRTHEHIINKYGENGYLKLPILTQSNKENLELLREISKDYNKFISICNDIYNNKINK